MESLQLSWLSNMFKISVRFGHMYGFLGEAFFAGIASLLPIKACPVRIMKSSNSGSREKQTVIANTLLSVSYGLSRTIGITAGVNPNAEGLDGIKSHGVNAGYFGGVGWGNVGGEINIAVSTDGSDANPFDHKMHKEGHVLGGTSSIPKLGFAEGFSAYLDFSFTRFVYGSKSRNLIGAVNKLDKSLKNKFGVTLAGLRVPKSTLVNYLKDGLSKLKN